MKHFQENTEKQFWEAGHIKCQEVLGGAPRPLGGHHPVFIANRRHSAWPTHRASLLERYVCLKRLNARPTARRMLSHHLPRLCHGSEHMTPEKPSKPAKQDLQTVAICVKKEPSSTKAKQEIVEKHELDGEKAPKHPSRRRPS